MESLDRELHWGHAIYFILEQMSKSGLEASVVSTDTKEDTDVESSIADQKENAYI